MRNCLPYILTLCILLFFSTQSFAQDAPQTSNQSLNQSGEQATVQPPWQICNETSYMLNIAIAGVPAGQAGRPVSVWGWQSLRSGKCEIIEVEKGTPRFVYARSDSMHQGGIREWKGRYDYCVASEDFTAKTETDCDEQKMTTKQFLQVIPTESRTAFIEPNDYGRFAETAGLQRLLGDNNYNIKRIDGRAGKRTTNTLRKFLKDQELKYSTNVDAQYLALQAAAHKTKQNVGVRFCNKSTGKLWSALAYNDNGSVESRGWWPIAIGACIHPFAENLQGRAVHYYVRQETKDGDDKVLKVSSKNAKPICIGPSKFSALRHEFCQDRGYVSANFKAVSGDGIGVKIDLTDADFDGELVNELR